MCLLPRISLKTILAFSLFFLYTNLWAQVATDTPLDTPAESATPTDTPTDTPTFTFTPTPVPSQVFHGVDWLSATENASFTPRMFHASAVFDPGDGKGPRMYVLGGLDNGSH